MKATDYVGLRNIDCAFVSTNSITQGEQVSLLWPTIFQRGFLIQFAHRTFKWRSEARGAAHVHVIIVGFSRANRSRKVIFDHTDATTREVVATNISPYLVDASNSAVTLRSRPLCAVPDMAMGNQPVDDGDYIFTEDQKDAFLTAEPAAARYMHRYLGAEEFLNGNDRWILLASKLHSERP